MEVRLAFGQRRNRLANALGELPGSTLVLEELGLSGLRAEAGARGRLSEARRVVSCPCVRSIVLLYGPSPLNGKTVLMPSFYFVPKVVERTLKECVSFH